MSEQNLNSTRCMSLSFGGICLGSKCLPLPSMGITNTPSGWLWCLVGSFFCVGKTQQSGMFLSMPWGVQCEGQITFHCYKHPLYVTDLFTTKANFVVVSVYVHSFQSMVVAPKKYVWSTFWSSAQRAGGRTCRMAKPFGVLVCVYHRIRPVLNNLFLLLKSHFWHGPECVTELSMSKGLCSSLPCVRVGLCCTLRRIMQFLPELVNQCICVSFTKVMVGVHVMF